ncbi:MAG: hypothetical protein JWP31_2043 [Aeromicrobium sp.]|nr:hypothetical protein [Aeromicrobium sp.]
MPDDDNWTGSSKRPWMNPPMNHKLGAGRGPWRWAMLVILAAVVGVIVVLVLVDTDHLSRGWAYAVLPIAIVSAALSRVLTIFKANAESQPDDDSTP